MNVTALSKKQLKKELTSMGLARSDIVMVHASLRKLGPIEDGAQGIICTVRELLGNGTMIMVLGSGEGDVFSALDSPADPEMGVLAEEFRNFPSSRVNDHPAARFCALGPMAEQLLDSPPLHDYYGEGSVLERFVNAGGKVLRLGADLDTVTLTHLAEYRADVFPKKKVKCKYLRKDIGEQWIESLDDSDGIQDWSGGDYFTELLKEYLNTGRANIGKVGQCKADLFSGQYYLDFSIKWLEKHLRAKDKAEL